MIAGVLGLYLAYLFLQVTNLAEEKELPSGSKAGRCEAGGGLTAKLHLNSIALNEWQFSMYVHAL